MANIMRLGGGGVGNSTKMPKFTYTGDYTLMSAADYGLEGDYDVLALKSSGTLTFAKDFMAEVFAVGAGGGGGTQSSYSSPSFGPGGGGGYTKTVKGAAFVKDREYTCLIGEGGVGGGNASTYAQGSAGGTTSIEGLISADGGTGGAATGYSTGVGGSGGSGGGGAANKDGYSGGDGGSDGGNGADGKTTGGTGQGTTTRAFGDENAALFAGGGAGCGHNTYHSGGAGGGGNSYGRTGTPGAGEANTGGGGAGGGYVKGAAGGSGIILIRPVQAV